MGGRSERGGKSSESSTSRQPAGRWNEPECFVAIDYMLQVIAKSSTFFRDDIDVDVSDRSVWVDWRFEICLASPP